MGLAAAGVAVVATARGIASATISGMRDHGVKQWARQQEGRDRAGFYTDVEQNIKLEELEQRVDRVEAGQGGASPDLEARVAQLERRTGVPPPEPATARADAAAELARHRRDQPRAQQPRTGPQHQQEKHVHRHEPGNRANWWNGREPGR